ncbi:hypothetical protein [Pedobacter heparinus]|uniref:hypothetical protein n=1 Tax=Pedobacter heparinus TaxID=984 RepID=UPI002930349C|nr:hypothetical protein [Pedobacter heparinus]
MKFRKKLLPVLVLLIIIAGTAFTQIGKSNITNKKTNVDYAYWFQYIGPTNEPIWFSDYTNPNNYVFLDSQDPYELCGYGQDALCSVLTERNWNGFEWKPDFSNTGYGSAYSGLYYFYTSGIPGTTAVHLKAQ